MSHPYLHPFNQHIGFNAQHSPMGAYFSFTCGHTSAGGGMAAERGGPPPQNLYIGVKEGDRRSEAPLRCLPFFTNADKSAADDYLIEQAAKEEKPKGLVAYPLDQIKRYYGWGSDRWATADFQFTIYTPFGPIPDPAKASAEQMRETILPAVIAELTVDNTHGKTPKTALIAMTFDRRGNRVLDTLGENRCGFAVGRAMGIAGQMLDGNAQAVQGWTPDLVLKGDVLLFHLPSCSGIHFEVPAGEKRTLRLAIGCYLEGLVSTRIEGTYLYTKYFGSLEDVLGYALDNYELLVVKASERDHELLNSKLSAEQQFLLAHATRSYYGSTQLLNVGGEPFWIVNEGEYCMLNTLDLSVDHVFWELRYNPWVVKNLLRNFVRYYSFRDQVKLPDGKGSFAATAGGISFCHDMGVNNNFSPLGTSCYEVAELNAVCFSHMTQEQLCNWTLMAGCYTAATDDSDWLTQNWPVLHDCLLSMQNRDHADPDKRTGVMQLDSARCGAKGAEITTYDSLDHSLAQSRNNLYIAVKCWATYLSLAMMFRKLGDAKHEHAAMESAKLAAKTVAAQMGTEGFIPAVFEKDNSGYRSRILPGIEALAYPLYWKSFDEALAAEAIDPKGPFAAMLAALRKHTETLVNDPQNRNRFPDGGIRLSSTSGNSWMSKIAIWQWVCREYFGLENGDAKQKAADTAHVHWEVDGESAFWAMSDQIVDGVARGSRYYPRCVTTVLWL